MVDERKFMNSQIGQEMTQENRNYWFDFKQRKFLHNIDTFYYSIKLTNDMTRDTIDAGVQHFRKYFQDMYSTIEYNDFQVFHVPGMENLILRNLTFARFYNVCLEYPDYFHVFLALSVPGGGNTCEVIVQIRSYMLWMYGVYESFERSYEYVKAVLDMFHLEVAFVQENRIDYCWHSNYLANPEKFFNIENFYKMRVDRYKGANFHTAKVGAEDYEIDYVSLGKRGDKCFVRIYLKSKEVVEMGYKPFFFKVWLFNGLINRYDLYCYEEAFKRRNWQYMTIARLNFYLDFGSNELLKSECRHYIRLYEESNSITDNTIAFANKITPAVHLIINVEYQTMRKSTKTYCLLKLRDNANKEVKKRVYDYFDNRPLIIDYLTRDVFRLVNPNQVDTNKSRRDYCAFWKALRSTKLVDMKMKPKDVKLVRDYTRKLNKETMKRTLINKAVVYGIYNKGINKDEVMQDCMQALLTLNDNDIAQATRYKNKKSLQFNRKELEGLKQQVMPQNNYVIVNTDTGAVYDYNSISDTPCQEEEKE